ncbi:MAG: YdiU family protein [Polyangiales bacterium]
MPFRFDNTYARLPAHFYARAPLHPAPAPRWLAVNVELGASLGLTVDELRAPELLLALAGNRVPEGAEPIALAYAGHQFGGFVPRLGDGRALLLGEALDAQGRRWDVQLKGSGPTPFSRGGDGRAALGPVLREFLVSEAMHALGVPTTRALAAVLTGDDVVRDEVLPGAVLTRVAASHLRVGTFQYFAARGDRDALETLVGVALARHYPEAVGAGAPALALLDAVMHAQASLVAAWLSVGFVHGVMNTDNCAVSGETLDYGPCAFLDAYDPKRRFSSIDHQGRYAFMNQPRIAQWNVARLAEALIPLVDADEARAVALLEARIATFGGTFEAAWMTRLRAKLGLREAREGDAALGQRLLDLMAAHRVDFTLAFRRLADLAEGLDAFSSLFADAAAIAAWRDDWRARVAAEGRPPAEVAAQMRAANPAFIPRNHRVEEMIAAAVEGDLGPFQRLRAVLARPYEDQPAHDDLALPPGEDQWRYRTFCGT